MPLSYLQLRRPTWPAVKDSLGKPRGAIPKSKLLYWEATGPALAVYKSLLPRILELLAEKQGAVPNSDFIWFALYMVGPNCEAALPHIMFASENASQRKKAMRIAKQSDILKDHPGMYFGEWAEAPHIGRQRQQAGHTESEQGLASLASLYSPENITIESVLSVGKQTSVVLAFRFQHEIIRATSSVYCTSKQGTLFLVPAHVLFPTHSSQDVGDEEGPESPISDFQFGGFPHELEDDDGWDEIGTGTSEGSFTISDPKSSDEDDMDNSLESDGSVASIKSLMDMPLAPTRPAVPGAGIGRIHDVNDFPIVSTNLDYALCHVMGFPDAESSISIPDLEWFSLSKIIQPREYESPAQVLTAHGKLNGTICRSSTYVRLPNSTKYEEVFNALFSPPITAGDCGAMVYNETGEKFYGHIVTGSSTSATFVVPAKRVFEDLLSQVLHRRRALPGQHLILDLEEDDVRELDSAEAGTATDTARLVTDFVLENPSAARTGSGKQRRSSSAHLTTLRPESTVDKEFTFDEPEWNKVHSWANDLELPFSDKIMHEDDKLASGTMICTAKQNTSGATPFPSNYLPPTIELEADSIAKEYGSKISIYPEEEPQNRGDIDQYPILIMPDEWRALNKGYTFNDN